MEVSALVKAAQRGDDDAFFKLISQNKDKLYSIAYSYFKNEQDSLEAIQEVTCRAYLKLKKLKEVQFFSTWLIRILINYCIDEKKRKDKVVYMDHQNFGTVLVSDSEYGSNENPISYNNSIFSNRSSLSENTLTDRLDLEAAVDLLEPRYKKVILLKYFNDMTVHDIARVMECPEGTIKTWVSRALGQLRANMYREGDLNV